MKKKNKVEKRNTKKLLLIILGVLAISAFFWPKTSNIHEPPPTSVTRTCQCLGIHVKNIPYSTCYGIPLACQSNELKIIRSTEPYQKTGACFELNEEECNKRSDCIFGVTFGGSPTCHNRN